MGYASVKSKGERTQLERLNSARADKTELEVKIKTGEYVALHDVRDAWLSMIQRFKSRLLLIPKSYCSQVSMEVDPTKNMMILEGAITQALMELTKIDVGELAPEVIEDDGFDSEDTDEGANEEEEKPKKKPNKVLKAKKPNKESKEEKPKKKPAGKKKATRKKKSPFKTVKTRKK